MGQASGMPCRWSTLPYLSGDPAAATAEEVSVFILSAVLALSLGFYKPTARRTRTQPINTRPDNHEHTTKKWHAS